ncbi:hypothetical protein IWQ47_000420 [Aquimarina sp. EL_43]|uniref:DUF3810 domain-containing protein n=2 Tax=Aquimarina TaxID=290174 RepID=UPI0018C9E825|nr:MULTISPECIES: DUF3810 domain-containing protein [unclassified Aquimarina]MBG6128887.1 hypothetical protein [Aquimarina sp. EL_35]MBG6149951.1 hypothetical protein [Aquimarina sp. EL_32]MBG6167362.1 hypothetical protein [Aquimarina sp. EL_43]
MQSKTKLYLTILLPVQIILIQILSFFPEVIERFYSNGLFVYISKALRYVFGWIPFSFGDILYCVLIIMLIRFLFKKVFKKRLLWKEVVLDIGATLSIVYACFHILWGMNYYRLPLHEILELDDEYTEEELITVSEKLIIQANSLHLQLESNDSLPIHIPYSKEEIFQKTIPAYDQLHQIFPVLQYHPKSIKTSILSLPLTYMGFSGYLNPITNEAQVNGLILNYKAPTTSCHEEAHQLGFAKENEANFIAALTTMNYDDIYFNYSGATFALKFCLNDLYIRNEEKAICLIEKLRPGIRRNYIEVNEFWESYENPLEPIFKSTYDSYLKANNQPDGMDTYSYVVALLVNYYKTKL